MANMLPNGKPFVGKLLWAVVTVAALTAGADGIQIDPLDANDNRVWEGVFKKTAFADPTNVRLEYKNNGPVYTYAGAGLAGNDYLYFYLPNGAFKADRGTWTMTDGVLRYTGSTVVFIR